MLLVEDDADVGNSLAALLEAWNYRMAQAANGQDALVCLARPVILMSGYAGGEARAGVKDAEVAAWLGPAAGHRERRRPPHLDKDSYAYAESYYEAAARYCGLRAGQHIVVREDDKGLLVKPDVAKHQMDTEAAAVAAAARRTVADGAGAAATDTIGLRPEPRPESGNGSSTVTTSKPTVAKAGPKRYHGAVALDPQRIGRDASRVAEEVLTHLAGLIGANVRVTLEIEVDIPGGAPDNVVRIVTENGRTLTFQDSAFESE